jgi:predicted DNA-binding transcriptional regulator YafY
VHFTDEEAHIVNQLIEGLDDTNMLKHNLRRKLVSVYDCTSMANSIVKGDNAININVLVEAIYSCRKVILHNYASSHTGIIDDRIVEPFGFTTNYVQVWCYEPKSGMNKLFKTSRIGAVQILDEPWQDADKHHEGYIDIFRMTGFEQQRVRLEVGMLARNLLIEEYPLSERDMVELGEGRWLLDTMVCNYLGIGRFVLGLMNDIKIVDSPDFEEYLRGEINLILNSIK